MNFYVTKTGSIYCRFFPRPYDQVKFYIGETIPISDWSKTRQNVKATNRRAPLLNKLIKSIEQFVDNALIEAKIKGTYYTSDQMKALLDERFFGKSSEVSIKTLSEYIDHWLSIKKNTVRKPSYRSYKSRLAVVNEMFPNVMLDEVNNGLLKKIEIELLSNGKYSNNYAYNTIKVTRGLVRDCWSDGYIKEWKPYKQIIKWKQTDTIYLSHDELNKLYNTKYKTAHLTNAVKLFLIGCYTGQRFSDFIRINKSMKFEIAGNQFIRLKQKKGVASYVTIPVHPILEEIFKDPPHPISADKLRSYIKDAAKEAKIDLSKCDKIGTHTARRSFATNLVLDGVPLDLVMKMGGWTTEKSFRSYIRYDDVIAGITIVENEAYIKSIAKAI